MDYFIKDGGFYTETSYGRLDISGDEQYGFRPYQLLVSAIAVCSGGVLRKILKKMRAEIDDMHIHADVKRNAQESDKIEKIHLHFKLSGTQLDEKKIERALALTRKHCSMIQSVKDSIEVTESVQIVS